MLFAVTMENNNNNINNNLPKQFLSAMRTLFDLMDDRKTGFVRFADIETRWREDGTKDLPKGVIECLRKVTPPNGMLSFERFCAGLKICLLRNKNEMTQMSRSAVGIHQTQSGSDVVAAVATQQVANKGVSTRPQSVPADRLIRDRAMPTEMPTEMPLTVRQASVSHLPVSKQSAAISQSRAVSMPHLGEKSHGDRRENREFVDEHGERRPAQKLSMPKHSGKPPETHVTTSRADIMTTLHNWHMGMRANAELKQKNRSTRPPADGRAVNQEFYGGNVADGDVVIPDESRKIITRRREPRRHTLASGIDYNMLKRMKQLEQEKDVLLQGLEAVDKAHDWYMKQINLVQDKMKQISKSAAQVEYSTDAHQERLNFQMARIFEVNQHLSALVESSERGFPLHMNLALRPMNFQSRSRRTADFDDPTVRRLREQNHLLTEEVSQKSDRITQLEREKSALIRELFQARAHTRREIDDTTFL